MSVSWTAEIGCVLVGGMTALTGRALEGGLESRVRFSKGSTPN